MVKLKSHWGWSGLYGLIIDIFNLLLLLSLSLALSSKLPIGLLLEYGLFVGSLLASASDSDSESNELKMSNKMLYKPRVSLPLSSKPVEKWRRCGRLKILKWPTQCSRHGALQDFHFFFTVVMFPFICFSLRPESV